MALENLEKLAGAFSLALSELLDLPEEETERASKEMRLLSLIRDQDSEGLDLVLGFTELFGGWMKG